jgi:hypothetical protein
MKTPLAITEAKVISSCAREASLIIMYFGSDVGTHLQNQFPALERKREQKGQRGQKRQNVSLFFFFVPFVLFAPSLPSTMNYDFENES